MIKKDYEDYEAIMPAEERRRKTYKKRWHPTYALKDALRLVPAIDATSDAAISEEQLAALEALIAEVVGEKSEVLRKALTKYFKVGTLSELPVGPATRTPSKQSKTKRGSDCAAKRSEAENLISRGDSPE